MRPSIHLYFEVSDLLPDEYIDSIEQDLNAKNLNLVVEKWEHGAFALNEWFMPSFVAAYLLKPYFEGFLQEAGRDHYSRLTNWIKTSIRNLKPITTTTVVAVGSTNKIDAKNTQSNVFSIQTRTLNGVTLKFLFDKNLSIEQWENASISALLLLEEYFINTPESKLKTMLASVTPQGGMVFAIINPETLTWEIRRAVN